MGLRNLTNTYTRQGMKGLRGHGGEGGVYNHFTFGGGVWEG